MSFQATVQDPQAGQRSAGCSAYIDLPYISFCKKFVCPLLPQLMLIFFSFLFLFFELFSLFSFLPLLVFINDVISARLYVGLPDSSGLLRRQHQHHNPPSSVLPLPPSLPPNLLTQVSSFFSFLFFSFLFFIFFNFIYIIFLILFIVCF